MFENGLLQSGMVSVFDRWYDFLNRTFQMQPDVIGMSMNLFSFVRMIHINCI